ncbi:MAG: hypothetical protein ACTS5I_07445 [Rhodanobacter sp.]
MDNSILLFLFGQIVTGAAIWGAIRSDIRNMVIRMNDIKATSDYAHKRIDDMLSYTHYRESN